MDITKEEIASLISQCSKYIKLKEAEKTDIGSREKPYTCYVSSELYNHIKIIAPNFLDDRDMYYAYTICYPGWVQVVVYDIKEQMSSAYGKIGHVNKPSRQEFMDAKYKRKNFAKDYLMKGKKW